MSIIRVSRWPWPSYPRSNLVCLFEPEYVTSYSSSIVTNVLGAVFCLLQAMSIIKVIIWPWPNYPRSILMCPFKPENVTSYSSCIVTNALGAVFCLLQAMSTIEVSFDLDLVTQGQIWCAHLNQNMRFPIEFHSNWYSRSSILPFASHVHHRGPHLTLI